MWMRNIKVKLADSKESPLQHMMQTSLWSPDGKPQLSSLAEMVSAENSDLYDVLAYIAYTSPPLSR